VRFVDEFLEVRQRAVLAMQIKVIRHVVAKVELRRLEDRSEPYAVNPKLGQVIQLLHYA